MPEYRITHETIYQHAAFSGAAWQMLQLQPRQEATQECLDFQLTIDPAAPDLSTRPDYFGNTRHFFSVREPHRELAITSHAVVRREAPALQLPALSPSVTEVWARTRALVESGEGFWLEQYLCATPLVPLPRAAAELANGIDYDRPVLEWIDALGRRFAEVFTFDATATTVSTPLSTVLEQKRGVCQDFTHLFLSCARQHGLPSAYVSGYLLTDPPPGKPRLRGADAMHAWASVHIPEIGWVDYDPTNSCFAGDGHLVVARGRDYSDVNPTRGVFTGSYSPVLKVAVTVEPVEAGPAHRAGSGEPRAES
jgi:transglutaminase-like putative cysteine protease